MKILSKEVKYFLTPTIINLNHPERGKNMNKTQSYAQRELDILIKTTPNTIIRHFTSEILALCEAFGNSEQSGGSAPYTAGALAEAVKKLCLQQPIAPLAGEDSEWNDVSNDVFQNNRCSAVFKEKGRAYYLDAIIWKTQKGSTWNGTTKEGIKSRQFIKAFPFRPKTFFVDVIEKEMSKDNWEFEIKDKKQLKKVAEYYNMEI